MRNAILYTLFLPFTILAQYTFWIDISCGSSTDAPFFRALTGAYDMAHLAWNKWIDKDIYTSFVFNKIFKADWEILDDPNNINDNQYAVRQVSSKSCSLFFMISRWKCWPDILFAFAHMTLELDQTKSNYRYFCDNDPQAPDGGTRWSLRPDVTNPPIGYQPQKERVGRLQNEIPYQEWEDIRNGVSLVRYLSTISVLTLDLACHGPH